MVRRPLCTLCLTCIAVFFLWQMFTGPPSMDADAWSGKELLIRGIVSGKEIREETQIVYLTNVTFCDRESFIREGSVSFNNLYSEYGLLCYMEGELPPIGAEVFLTGRFMMFNEATNPGEFDQRNYYLLQGYFGKVMNAELVGVSAEYDIWQEGLFRIKNYLGSVLDSVLDEQDSSVMKAMLLGEKSQMDKDIKRLYQSNGIAHVLAISGLHVSIIGVGLYGVLKKLSLPTGFSACFSLFVMVNYAVMTGAGTSTIRAVVMFGFAVMAGCFRRSYDLPTALSVAALCTIISNPYVVWQSGFWMSYLAVAGIAVLYPAVIRDIEIEDKRKKAVFNSVMGGFCVTVSTLPVLLLNYYEYPVYSIFINLIILPFMGILLTVGLFCVITGSIFLPAGQMIGWIVHIILMLYERICSAALKLPGRSWIAGAPDIYKIVMFYGIMIAIIASGRKLGKRKLYELKFRSRLCLICLAVLILGFRIDAGLTITVLDVGQGDGICIRTADIVCMIDGGSSSKSSLAQYQLEPFLKHEGISEIDYWFITHPDKDHCSGYIEMMEQGRESGITLHTLVLPDAYGVMDSCKDLIELAGNNGVDVLLLSAGEYILSGDLKILVLHPREGYRADDINEISMVLSVEYGNFCGIFTGDATVESEREIIRYWEEHGCGPVQMLKVGHHGSSTSTSEAFLQYCNPQIAVISCGRNNRYGHPHEELLKRLEDAGCHIYQTRESGAVTVRVKAGTASVEEFLEKAY